MQPSTSATRGIVRGLVAGLLAAGVAVAIMMGVGVLTRQATVAEGIAQAIAGLTPSGIIEPLVIRMGESAKHALFATALVGMVGAGVVVGALSTRGGWSRGRVTTVVLAAAAALGIALVAAVATGTLGTPNFSLAVSFIISLAIATVVYLIGLLAITGRLGPGETEYSLENPRREFLKKSLLGLGGIVVGGSLARWIFESVASPEVISAQGAPPTPPDDPSQTPALVQALTDGVPGLVPEVTPNDKFYLVSKNVFRDPDVNAGDWRLQIKGLVDSPMTLTYTDLKNMPSSTQYLTLQCISNVVGGDLMSNAKWQGVALGDLLRQAGVRDSAFDVIVRSADDYSDSIPIAKALQPNTMLVYAMNDQPLPQKHGFPARLLVPDIYGMKNAKWVTEIEVVEYDYKGYWQNRGWSDVATMHITSRIDAPRNNNHLSAGANYIGGVAVAGQRGIQEVDVSTDGGQTWQPAAIKPPLGQDTWVLWLYEWDVPQGATGDRQVMVRAIDGTGAVQDGTPRDTLPDGATGYHTITVHLG